MSCLFHDVKVFYCFETNVLITLIDNVLHSYLLILILSTIRDPSKNYKDTGHHRYLLLHRWYRTIFVTFVPSFTSFHFQIRYGGPFV